ncbi:MAG: proton-conducting transporter transmembrane domain-containing protein [Desulfobulbaceae bacterium]
MTFFCAALLLLLLSGLLALPGRSGSAFWDRLSLTAGLAGALLGLGATLYCLGQPQAASLSLPWSGGAHFSLRLDGLAAVFLLPAFLMGGCGLLYGTGYWPHASQPGSSTWIRTFYPLLLASIALLLTADNGVVFLIGWEIMAMCSYLLVVTEWRQGQVQQPGFIYLAVTHAGTLALFGMFALLGEETCLTTMPATGSLSIAATPFAHAIFLLALFGFGCKAGIMPMHIWLPGAHAAAPSHVSALMSGIVIKTGIYGLLRLTSFFQVPADWWGWLILGLGVVSGVIGVVFAIAQHDIKRLLAYHSIENIGIILIGVGSAMLGRSYGLAAIAALGMAGALLHVINHGLFKGLLFLSAGSMIHATGTRQMTAYGGLARTMPLTALFFLGGAIAICGLPPLNGFVSEWLIYLGLLQAGRAATGPLLTILLAVPALAMIGGLALLCFAKVFGLSFLGTPRTERAAAHEAPIPMLAAMGLLLAACLWIGLAPATVLPLLSRGVNQWLGQVNQTPVTLTALAPVGYISGAALLLLLGLALVFFLTRRGRMDAIPLAPTWGCGYSNPLPRAQYSTSSFAEMIMNLFNWSLYTRFHQENPTGLFPAKGSFQSHTPDGVLDILLLPGCHALAGIATRFRRTIHQGIIGIYLLYTALTLCLLLFLSIFLY